MLSFKGLSRKSGPDSSSPKSPTSSNAASEAPSQIDTRAPFQSVKAAIGLFGLANGGGLVHKRSKSTLDERVLEKETQHHLTIKELESLKEQLRNIETTKAQAIKDLDNAKYTMDKLTSKLEALCDSKQAAIAATEDAKKRLEQLEEERLSNKGVKLVDEVRNQYKATTVEISSVKQEITTLKQDFDAALEAKLAAFQEAAEAQHVTQVNQQKAAELSEEISNLQRELNEVKMIAQQAEEDHSKLVAEKEARIQSCKASREENENKIKAMEGGSSGLNEDENCTEKLEETKEAITLVTEQLNSARASDLEALKSTTSELETAKKELQQLVTEQNSLTILVHSLKQKLEKNTACISKAEELKKQAEVYKQEAQTARLATEETEKKLQIAMTEAKEAKAALNLESIIKLPAEEVDGLKKKVEESKINADFKVATAMAQVETIKEAEKPMLHKLEECQKEKDALKAAIEDAIKQADMADAAREVVEGELRKWRHDKDHNEENLKIKEGEKL